MKAETVLRKLHLYKALSDEELEACLNKVKSDGSLPPDEILALLELMTGRSENLPTDCIREVASLVGGNSAKDAGKFDEGHAMRAIVSKLAK